MTDEADEWYAVRCVFRWTEADDRPYEERITLWRAADLDAAIVLAEAEAREYAENTGVTYLGLAQGYETGEKELTEGSEVFSLLRESALPPEEYLDRHFDTCGEHQHHMTGGGSWASRRWSSNPEGPNGARRCARRRPPGYSG